MSFAELLKSKDMTAARLSRRLHVTRETVGNWVHGRNAPSSVFTLSAIAKELNVSMEEVINCLKKSAEKINKKRR